MRSLLAILAIAVMAVGATAGQNPQVYAYISFDPAGDPEQHTVTPAMFTTVNAYVCLGCLDGGMTVVSFGLNNVVADYAGVVATQSFVNLLPGGLAIGDPFAGGVTVASTECMLMDPVVVGYGSYFYMGNTPGLTDACVKLVDHVDYPRWVVDCQEPGVEDYYCVAGNGTIVAAGSAIDCSEGVEECLCGSPVEDATWGGIKALYQ
jgi:hypothetical protein